MNLRAACFVALLLACGGPSNGSADPKRECAALAKTAHDDLDALFAANQSCTKNEDCGFASWSTKCAVRNTRLIAVAARPKLEAETAKLDADACATFEAKACDLERDPPAEPPRPPSCIATRCAP